MADTFVENYARSNSKFYRLYNEITDEIEMHSGPAPSRRIGYSITDPEMSGIYDTSTLGYG